MAEGTLGVDAAAVLRLLKGEPGAIEDAAGFAAFHDVATLTGAVRAALERAFGDAIAVERASGRDSSRPSGAETEKLAVVVKPTGERLTIIVVRGAGDEPLPKAADRLVPRDSREPVVALIGAPVIRAVAEELEEWRGFLATRSPSPAVIVLPWELWPVVRDFSPSPPAALRARMLADRPLEDGALDKLDFGPLARGLAHLIDNPETDTPLVVAINAPWGSGKTSLARMMLRELEDKPAAGGARPHVTFWFDAWMHDEAASLPSAFLAALARFLTRRRPWWARLLRPLPTELWTTRGQRAWRLTLLLAMAIGCVAAALAAASIAPGVIAEPIKGISGDVLKISGAALGAAVAAYAMILLKQLLEFGGKLGDFVADPKGESARGGLTRVRAQLRALIRRAVPEGSRLVIVVDDLERCRPPGAVELLEAINQHLAHAGVVVVLLADMAAVGASAVAKYETLAKHYGPADGAAAGAGELGEFGRRHLQKLIQLQFNLPEPRPEQIGRLVDELVLEPEAPRDAMPSGRAARAWRWLLPRSFATAAWRPEIDAAGFVGRWGAGTPLADLVGRLVAMLQLPAFWCARSMVNGYFPDPPRAIRERVPPTWVHATGYAIAAVATLALAAVLLALDPDIGAVPPLSFVREAIAALQHGFVYGAAGPVSATADLVERRSTGFFILMPLLSVMIWFGAVFAAGYPAGLHAILEQQRCTREIARVRRSDPAKLGSAAEANSAFASALIRERRALALVNDSDEFRVARDEALGYLRLRPRAVKRLVNRLRLTISILAERGALGRDGLTAQAIGKWVALQELWPDLAQHVARDPGWLLLLEERARRIGTRTRGAGGEDEEDFLALVRRATPQFTDFNRLHDFVVAEPPLAPLVDMLIHMAPR